MFLIFSMVGNSDAGAGPVSSCVKRKRTSRVTIGQLDALLSKLEARPFLSTRKFTGLQGKEHFVTGWKEIADELNQLPYGSVKTPKQWITVWRDIKSRACSKAAKLRKERMQTGNRGITTAPLTETEKKIISLIGVEYTFGSDCPDSMLQEETLQHEMEAGVELVEVISLSQCNEYKLLETERDQASPAPQIIASGSKATAVVSPPPTEQQKHEETMPSSAPQINLNPRQTVAEQENTARQDFLAVTESNAESMRMLAAVTQLQAEAVKMQAEAAKVQAEASKVQAEASLLLAQAASKIGDALILFVNKNNK